MIFSLLKTKAGGGEAVELLSSRESFIRWRSIVECRNAPSVSLICHFARNDGKNCNTFLTILAIPRWKLFWRFVKLSAIMRCSRQKLQSDMNISKMTVCRWKAGMGRWLKYEQRMKGNVGGEELWKVTMVTHGSFVLVCNKLNEMKRLGSHYSLVSIVIFLLFTQSISVDSSNLSR